MSLRETGILTTAELKEMGMFPSEERMRKGPVAIAECVEHIPCNPCETSCPFHAICVGDHISNLPNVDFGVCTGCCSCVSACSGLAIFIMDKSYSDTVGSVSFPYEYVTPYKVGEQAWDCAREEPARYWCRRSCGRNWDFRQRRLVSPHQGRRSVRLLLVVSEV